MFLFFKLEKEAEAWRILGSVGFSCSGIVLEMFGEDELVVVVI